MNVLQFLNIEPRDPLIEKKEIKNIEETSSCYNINIGDLVRIIRHPDSKYNCYKGYIGEVYEKHKGKSTVKVLIIACNSVVFLYIPYSHFVKV